VSNLTEAQRKAIEHFTSDAAMKIFTAGHVEALRSILNNQPGESEPAGAGVIAAAEAVIQADRDQALTNDHINALDNAIAIQRGTVKLPGNAAAEGEATWNGWRRAGSLLYRLTDGRRPENRDEINVTMADGSRESAPREERAKELLALLDGTVNP
jgi:hypothetical protein